MRAQSGGSNSDGCAKVLGSKVFWILVVVLVVIGMCSDPQEDGEAEEYNVAHDEATSHIGTESCARGICADR